VTRSQINSRWTGRDDGSILPLALVMSVVISVIVMSLATYIVTGLRYGHVVEDRADRLAAADGGMRYAIERLQNSAYAGCLTNMGNAGYTIDFPQKINEAQVNVTCTKGSNSIGDIKAWAIVVTGQGVPAGQWMWQTQAGGGQTKLLGGPVWITDPGRSDLKSPIEVEDGDIWYYGADCSAPNLTLESNLTFTPSYRGTICVDKPWNVVYTAPTVGAFPAFNDAANTNPPVVVDGAGCTVVRPGRYTAMPSLGANTYFKSGNYYFHDVLIDITNATVTGGWPDQNKYGDKQFVVNAKCDGAMAADKATGSAAGATLYLGGSSRIEIGNKGQLEIMRRLQGDSLVSIQVIENTTANASASTLGYNTNVVWTKSGANSDLALHGLLWAPKAQLEFGNVTNAANGQLLGGAAVARIVLQASASANAFVIRVEGSPIKFELRIDSKATLNGQSTTMTAVVQMDDQGTTAVNSMRVR